MTKPIRVGKQHTTWRVDDLRLVFSRPPTHQDAAILAKQLGRTAKAVENVYKWAITPAEMIPDSDHGRKIHRAARQMGWLTGAGIKSSNWARGIA
jgi:hypothetical protein